MIRPVLHLTLQEQLTTLGAVIPFCDVILYATTQLTPPDDVRCVLFKQIRINTPLHISSFGKTPDLYFLLVIVVSRPSSLATAGRQVKY